MNRKDLPFLFLLVGLLILLPVIDRKWIAPRFQRSAPPAPPVERVDPALSPAVVAASGNAMAPAAPAAPILSAAVKMADDEPASPEPGTSVTLTNAQVSLTFTSRGASLVEAVMHEYPLSRTEDSGPVNLDFTASPALAYEGISGMGDAHNFSVTVGADGRSARFERRNAKGLVLARTVELPEAGYAAVIRDEFRNAGTTPVALDSAWIRLGEMRDLPGETRMRGIALLGVDTLSPGDKARHWGAKLPRVYEDAAGVWPPPGRISAPLLVAGQAADWMAVKSKYFVQILRPQDRFERVDVRMSGTPELGGSGCGSRKTVAVESVATAGLCAPAAVEPGDGTERVYELFIGPKKYDALVQLDAKRVDVMEFGWAGGIGKILLSTLNRLYAVVPNYGIAIMLLTVIIRIVFWPLTHKSTESMKRMQSVAPLVNELKAKYKDNPQRQQREIMELYKEKKINPLSGCLPILVQLPVLISLFVVLRGAIELRFAPFLWIGDLSEPENLLKGHLPWGMGLNLLPLVMTVMQVWQTKLTPTGGDPSQQKMMIWMPVIMLYFFYGFPAGLVLYWTTNQTLMIGQMMRQRLRTRHGSKEARAS